MKRQRTVILATLAALLLFNGVDCVSPWLADEEAMECCASMECGPSNQSQDCCQTALSADYLSSQPAAKYHPNPDFVLSDFNFEIPLVSNSPQIPARPAIDIYEHGPPRELYTLFLALLI